MAITAEQFATGMDKLVEGQAKSMENILTTLFNAVVKPMEERHQEENRKMMAALMEKKTNIGQPEDKRESYLAERCGTGIPDKFNGNEAMWYEWYAKTRAYLRIIWKDSDEWLNTGLKSDQEMTMETIRATYVDHEDVVRFSVKLQGHLTSNTSGVAFDMVSAAGEGGLGIESLRRLIKRFDPKTPGAQRAVLMNILNSQSCKDSGDLEASVTKLERLIRKYEDMAGPEGKLPDNLVATLLINICPEKVKEHLELATKDMSRVEVKEAINVHIERKRITATEKVQRMEASSFDERWGQGQWQEEMHNEWWAHPGESECTPCGEELNAFGKGYGKNGGKGFGKNGGKGFGGGFGGAWQGTWNNPKGMGKGFGKGYGKSDNPAGKGKGKGKGDNKCHWCLKEGHFARECKEKDAYMARLRGEVNYCAEETPSAGNPGGVAKPKPSDIENLEVAAQGTYRYLGSFESANPFSSLRSEENEIEGPPGLDSEDFMELDTSSIKKKVKMPKYQAPQKAWKKKSGELRELSSFEKLEKPARQREDSNGMFWQSVEDLEREKQNLRSGVKELMTVEQNTEYEYIEATVDSGAADSVGSRKHARRCQVIPSQGSIAGVRYVSASGTVISNEGEKHVQVVTERGNKRTMNLQVANVHRVLLSVSKICDAGNEVFFNKDGGKIVNIETGEVDHFDRVDGVYRIKLKVIGDGSKSSTFRRP